MLTPTQLQQVREKIILARHPECKTIEEAVAKELLFMQEEYGTYNLNWLDFQGLPLDLASVLNALGGLYSAGGGEIFYWDYHPRENVFLCDWQLLKDGKPCTFDDQTPESQEAIARVLGII